MTVFIKSDIIDEIAIALEEFGNTQGYNFTSQFYQDIAWSGLTHIKDPNTSGEENPNYILNPAFQDAVPNSFSRNRILNRINAEKYDINTNGYVQQGNDTCN